MLTYTIDSMRPDDWDDVRAIYEEGMATGLATFETHAPDWPAWNSAHHAACRIVARAEGRVAGWAALSPVSSRKVYAGVAELSVYIAGWARGQGIGKGLLAALIPLSEQAGIWTLQASIFAVNRASYALHAGAGFREVGRRERIAQRDGIWRDTIILERRSRVVGV